jgi:hypothetical protein
MNAHSFRTEITCTPTQPIGLTDSILTIGSCFAELFGGWLMDHKFRVMANPFGTIYNPISIHKALTDSLLHHLDEQLFIDHRQLWHHLGYHSRWSSPDKDVVKSRIQNQQQEVKAFLEEMDVLIITYGTAWVYEYKQGQQIVANCHKLPSTLFTKRLLKVQEMEESFVKLMQLLTGINPKVRIILTVSPVRHVKDTLVLNSVSKAVLRLACHHLSETHPQADYFPSYEIMMDDLRDYRFYERDKIHPTEEALDYISYKFSDRYFTAETRSFINQWETIRQALAHRAYHPDTAAHHHFLNSLLHKLETIQGVVNVAEEIESVKSQLHRNA